jgi:tellurite resistance protein TerC
VLVVDVSLWVWGGVIAGLLALLMIDLVVVDHDPHELSLKEAGSWAALYIGVAIAFGIGLLFWQGADIAGQYFAGYLVEESLSVDNLFVFVLIMSMFAVPIVHQHKVLLVGIIGALVLRAAFIAGGVALLDRLHWVIYIFGAFLIATGIRLALHRDDEPDLSRNPVLRLAQRVLPTTPDYDGGRLLTTVNGRRLVTPMALVMITIATTDVLFAVDSIPAVFGVTREPFLVFTSNAFALVGLRSLYFLLAGAVRKLVYLNVGLSVILCFVGAKMLAESVVHVPIWLSLLVIVGVLTVTVAASLRRTAALEAAAPDGTPAPGSVATDEQNHSHHQPEGDHGIAQHHRR